MDESWSDTKGKHEMKRQMIHVKGDRCRNILNGKMTPLEGSREMNKNDVTTKYENVRTNLSLKRRKTSKYFAKQSPFK